MRLEGVPIALSTMATLVGVRLLLCWNLFDALIERMSWRLSPACG